MNFNFCDDRQIDRKACWTAPSQLEIGILLGKTFKYWKFVNFVMRIPDPARRQRRVHVSASCRGGRTCPGARATERDWGPGGARRRWDVRGIHTYKKIQLSFCPFVLLKHLFWCYRETPNLLTRRSKLGPSIDNLAIVYLFLARPPLDWRSLCYQTKLLQSGGGQASNK